MWPLERIIKGRDLGYSFQKTDSWEMIVRSLPGLQLVLGSEWRWWFKTVMGTCVYDNRHKY